MFINTLNKVLEHNKINAEIFLGVKFSLDLYLWVVLKFLTNLSQTF